MASIKTKKELVGIRTRYHYATMPFTTVAHMLQMPIPPDAYLSEDDNSKALRELLAKGYRWVRTDGDLCIFEKIIQI
jgi:hypothetical protein